TAGLAARFNGVPVIQRVGGPGDLTDRPAVRWAQRHIVSAIVVPSSATRSAVLAHAWIRPDSVRTIPNGVDVGRYRPGPGAGVLRREIGASAQDFVVVTTGQLTRIKGHRFLLTAARELLDRGLPLRVALAGQGREE